MEPDVDVLADWEGHRPAVVDDPVVLLPEVVAPPDVVVDMEVAAAGVDAADVVAPPEVEVDADPPVVAR